MESSSGHMEELSSELSSYDETGSEYVPDSDASETSDAETLPKFNVWPALRKTWKLDRTAKSSSCITEVDLKAAGLFTSCTAGVINAQPWDCNAQPTCSSDITQPGDCNAQPTCSSDITQPGDCNAQPTCSSDITQPGNCNAEPTSSSDITQPGDCNAQPICSSNVTVHIATNTCEKRVWNKQNRCNFCEKLSTNLTKHIFSAHKNEPDVALNLSKPKNSGERAHLLEKMRNLGNYKHNCAVLKEGRGELIPWRSPTSDVDPSDYIPCEYCLGFFLKKELWRHQNTCTFKAPSAKKGRKVISRSQMLLPAETSCSDGLKDNIFSTMRADEITLVARKDPLIVAYGEKLYESHGNHKHKRQYIKQKLRQLANFVIAARKESPEISNLQSCIEPSKFPVVILAVRRLCGYISTENAYSNPSLALKLGHSLKRCATVLRNIALMKEDANLQQKAEDFNTLCDSDWQTFVSSAALATLQKKKYNVPHVLPLTEDVKRITKYLVAERRNRIMKLKSEPSAAAWHALAKVTLSSIILFNRRRSGEAARMLCSDFENAKTATVPQDDVLSSLSEMEKTLVNNFVRVEIVGKRGRKVPVLLTHDMCSEIEVLCACRAQVGVSSSNPYVFGRPYFSSEDHMSGHECLHEAAVKSETKHPENMTSTKLRKHIATVSQILNLSEHELDQLCGFLGHDVRVHREFYRLPEDTLQLAKVSRLLIAVEQGRISEFKGKPLNEIQVDMNFQECDVELEEDSDNEIDDPDDEMELRQYNDYQPESSSEQQIASRGNYHHERETASKRQKTASGDIGHHERETASKRQKTASGDIGHHERETASKRQKTASRGSGHEQRETASKRQKTASRGRPIELETTSKGNNNQPEAASMQKSVSKTVCNTNNKDFMTGDQLQSVHNYFKQHIESRQVPKKSDCERFLKIEPLLDGKSWTKIKCTVRNEIERRKRQVKRLQNR